MTYPQSLAVISPHIRRVSNHSDPLAKEPMIFLEAWAALLVKRSADGRFSFQQVYRHDQSGGASVELLVDMLSLVRHPTTLAAFRVGELATSLVKVPLGSIDQVRGKVALLHLRDAAMRQPIDVAHLDSQGGVPTLRRAALACDLPAEWDEPGASYNPVRLYQQLTARTQAMWVAIAKDRLPSAGAWQAMFDFANWKETQLTD